MRILNAPLIDTCGTGIRTKWAFDRLEPTWSYRVAGRRQGFGDYPTDAGWNEVPNLWRWADVIHFRSNMTVQQILRLPTKPAVIHQHGTQFRGNPGRYLKLPRARGMLTLVSTLDLYLLAPEHTAWAPACYNLDWLAAHADRPGGEPGVDRKLRVAHAPSNRLVKSTNMFLAAARTIPDIEVVLIEHQTWADCLRTKGTCDVYFDQVKLGYGCNAVEAWGMGMPVIAGAAQETLDEMDSRFPRPFHTAEETPESVTAALTAMLDPDVRNRWARRGEDHNRAFHAEEVVVPQLKAHYLAAHEKFHNR